MGKIQRPIVILIKLECLSKGTFFANNPYIWMIEFSRLALISQVVVRSVYTSSENIQSFSELTAEKESGLSGLSGLNSSQIGIQQNLVL